MPPYLSMVCPVGYFSQQESIQTALSARHKPAPKQIAQKRAPVSKYMYRDS